VSTKSGQFQSATSVDAHELLGAPCSLKVHQLELRVGRRNIQSSQSRDS
jgi:hypothetical protein